MYTNFLCIILLLSSVAQGQEYYTFESASSDRSFQGRVLWYNSETEEVSVRRKESKKTFVFKMSLLAEESQNYVKKQAKSLQYAKEVTVGIRKLKPIVTKSFYKGVRPDSLHPNDVSSEFKPTQKSETAAYEITVTNIGGNEISDLSIEYTHVKVRGRDSKLFSKTIKNRYKKGDFLPVDFRTEESGKIEIKPLATGKSVTLKTSAMDVVDVLFPEVTEDRLVYSNGRQEGVTITIAEAVSQRDRLIGLEIKLLHDGNVIESRLSGNVRLLKMMLENK